MAEFISLKEGVSKTLKKGDTVCFEGFTHLIPHASAHEVVRQKIDDLTIIRMTPDVIYDQLIGMGLVKKMIFSLFMDNKFINIQVNAFIKLVSKLKK